MFSALLVGTICLFLCSTTVFKSYAFSEQFYL